MIIKNYIVYILLSCVPCLLNAQSLAADLLGAIETYGKAEYANLDVDIELFASHNANIPTSTYKGKVIRNKEQYYVQNDFLLMIVDGKMMVLLNKLDKTVSCREVRPNENKTIFKEIEAFDFSSAIHQTDSILKQATSVKLISNEMGNRKYHVDFSKGMYKSMEVTFSSGFISEITYWYNKAYTDNNSKVTVKYHNISFDVVKTFPVLPNDIVTKNVKGQFVLAPAYKNYELIIINDDDQ